MKLSTIESGNAGIDPNKPCMASDRRLRYEASPEGQSDDSSFQSLKYFICRSSSLAFLGVLHPWLDVMG